MITTDLLTKAKKLDQYISDATDNGTGNDKFDSTTLMEWEVPTGRRWFLFQGMVNPDNSSTVTVTVKNSADKILYKLAAYGAGTATVSLIDPAVFASAGIPIVMDAGDYVGLDYGTAQGGSAEATCVVLEIKI